MTTNDTIIHNTYPSDRLYQYSVPLANEDLCYVGQTIVYLFGHVIKDSAPSLFFVEL